MVTLSTLPFFPSDARAQDQTRNEVWPEINAFYRFDAKYRLFLLFAPSFSEDDNYAESQVGAHIEMGILPIFRKQLSATHDIDRYRFLHFRVGIRHSWSLQSSEALSEEWRGVVEATGRASLPFDALASLRTRFDLRWVEGNYSTRYRTRLKFEKDTEIVSGYSIIPFASGEIFYDTRYKSWSRVQYQVGITFPIIRMLAFEAYYSRQNNWFSQPARVNAVGLVAVLYF